MFLLSLKGSLHMVAFGEMAGVCGRGGRWRRAPGAGGIANLRGGGTV